MQKQSGVAIQTRVVARPRRRKNYVDELQREKEVVARQLTYDELLTDYFQTLGRIANMLDKDLDEVVKYFENRRDVVIRGMYVRKKTAEEMLLV